MAGWLETPNYIPTDVGGACYFCGANQRVVVTDDGPRPERLMRWEGDIAFEGSVVMCESCVADMARQLGYATPEDTAAMSHRLAAVTAAYEAAEHRAEQAESTVAVLRDYDAAHVAVEAPATGTAATPKPRQTAKAGA